jgi:uncharacterized OB-fold protein
LGVAAFDEGGCSVLSQAESPGKVKVKAKVKPEAEVRRDHTSPSVCVPST